jgi:hypothetical protein
MHPAEKWAVKNARPAFKFFTGHLFADFPSALKRAQGGRAGCARAPESESCQDYS